jgi:hypothetical protein
MPVIDAAMKIIGAARRTFSIKVSRFHNERAASSISEICVQKDNEQDEDGK